MENEEGNREWEVGSGKWGSGEWEVGKWGSCLITLSPYLLNPDS
ncbi:hypothetical protein [Microcystis aeruginosa]|nr:hypothetical protein [Microcystis aeruginosa]